MRQFVDLSENGWLHNSIALKTELKQCFPIDQIIKFHLQYYILIERENILGWNVGRNEIDDENNIKMVKRVFACGRLIK